jgi:hypothetical protein
VLKDFDLRLMTNIPSSNYPTVDHQVARGFRDCSPYTKTELCKIVPKQISESAGRKIRKKLGRTGLK